VRLNSSAWCDGGTKRENDLQQSDTLDTNNIILKIICNYCLGISNTARPLFVCFNKRCICIIHTGSVHMASYRVKEKSTKDKLSIIRSSELLRKATTEL